MSWHTQLSTSFQVIAILSYGTLYFLMLTIEECKEHLTNFNLTDEQIKAIRNNLYRVSEKVLNQYLDNQLRK